MRYRYKRFSMHTLAAETPGETWRPAADVYVIPNGYLVKLELAGVRAEDLAIELKNDTLRVRGFRRDLLVCDAQSCYSLEIPYSPFRRSIRLPGVPANPKLSVEYRDGMLLVFIVEQA